MLNYTDTKKKLSVHNIIGAEDYTKIKTLESKKTIPGQLVAELIKLDRVVISPSQEIVTNML